MWRISEWYEQALAESRKNTPLVRNLAGLRLELLRQPGGLSEESHRKALLAFHASRYDAVPDFARYPEIRGMRELLLAANRGLAEGAELDALQLAAYVSGMAYYCRFIQNAPVPADTQAGKANCSWIYFPTSDQGPLAANNLDSSPRELFGPPAWPLVNENILMGGVSSGIYMDEPSPEIFPAPVFKLVARYCRTTDEAVEMLTRYTHFWGPGNLLVADSRHRVAMIEKSACRIGVRRSPDGFGFITAMTAEEPGMHAYLADRRAASVRARNLPPGNADEAYWAKQDARRALMNGLLDEARQHPTVETLRRFIQFRDPVRGNVCGFGEPVIPGGPASEFTIRTSLFELRNRKAHWWAQEGDTPSWTRPMPVQDFPDAISWN